MAMWVPSFVGFEWWFQNFLQDGSCKKMLFYWCTYEYKSGHSTLTPLWEFPFTLINAPQQIRSLIPPPLYHLEALWRRTIPFFTYSPSSPLSDCQPPHSCVPRCCHTPQGAHVVPALYFTNAVQFGGRRASPPQTSLVYFQRPQQYTQTCRTPNGPTPWSPKSPPPFTRTYGGCHRLPGPTTRPTQAPPDTQTLLNQHTRPQHLREKV